MNNKIQITPRLPFNVGPLLEPKAVAIVGVSAGERSFGNFVLSNLNRFGFKGAIHLVSRSSDRMGEHVCVPSIDDLPDGIDVAVLTVPEAAVIESIEACGRRGIKAAVVFASGFAEAGEEGRQKQELLSRVATDNNVMVVGPMISLSRPAARRLLLSICQRRSWACTNPCAMKRSCSFSA